MRSGRCRAVQMHELGAKIKRLRQAAQMTQVELAGDFITRNMLSQIENGSAQPSLPTIQYLAGRLNIPAGYFFAEEEDEFVYRKMLHIKEIRRAYTEHAWQRCIDLCQDSLGGSDDELNLILARSAYELALQSFTEGRLCAAHTGFVQAYEYAIQTVYDTASLLRTVYDYLNFLEQFDSALEIPAFIKAPRYDQISEQPGFSFYTFALRRIREGKYETIELLLNLPELTEKIYAAHIRARIAMAKHAYADAIAIIEALLEPEHSPQPGKPMIYLLCGDLEICCRESGDYERAYRYTTSRAKLLDALLID